MKVRIHQAWFVFAMVTAPLTGGAVVTNDFSHYQIVIDRAPFGELKEVVTQTNAPSAAAAQSFIRDWRLVGMTKSGNEIQVALVNIQNNNSYLLTVGDDVENGIVVDAADYDGETVSLKMGDEKHWLGMGEAGTDGAAPGGAPGVAGSGDGSAQDTERVSASRRASRRRETSRHRDVDPPQLTGDDLKKHLEDYQMELIRKGEPPLPIPLTKEMDDQLVKEGVLTPLKK